MLRSKGKPTMARSTPASSTRRIKRPEETSKQIIKEKIDETQRASKRSDTMASATSLLPSQQLRRLSRAPDRSGKEKRTQLEPTQSSRVGQKQSTGTKPKTITDLYFDQFIVTKFATYYQTD